MTETQAVLLILVAGGILGLLWNISQKLEETVRLLRGIAATGRPQD